MPVQINDENTVAIRTEVNDGVAQIIIQRPLRRNSMDREFVDRMRASLLEYSLSSEVYVIIIRGTELGFCAGSDLKYISQLDVGELSRFEQECGDLGRLIGFIDKPVIAAVEGFAIGGGFTLATCCDLVVTTSSAKWSLPEVPHGWLTPWGITSIVNRVGFVKARQLSFGVDVLDGTQVVALGLADYSAEEGQVAAVALELAKRLSALPAPAVIATKRFFSNYLMERAEAMDFEANRLFTQNALEPAAQRTFEKFKGATSAESKQ